jgi:hypothetical protein
MVYDQTDDNKPAEMTGKPGFTIHKSQPGDEHTYSIYTDDGRGNGDYVCGVTDDYWARRIAHSLDQLNAGNFDFVGVLKTR